MIRGNRIQYSTVTKATLLATVVESQRARKALLYCLGWVARGTFHVRLNGSSLVPLFEFVLCLFVQVWGTASGGYCDELRLKSNTIDTIDSSVSNSSNFINLRAHGGSFDFENTKVQFSVVFRLFDRCRKSKLAISGTRSIRANKK